MDKSLRILLLEDNPFDAELAQHELESAKISFTALRVETREEFLKALTEFSPDVILSDYSLPDFNGKEALVIAKERAPATPFILVTGSVSEETAIDCMKAGAADYILKGRLKRLAPAVEAALEFRRMATHRQQAEGALRESEMKFRALAETSPYAIVVYRDDKILYANKTVETISGYTLGEVSSVSYLQLVHPDFRDLVVKRASARLRGELVPPRYELKILTKGGDERWIHVTAGLIQYEGEPAGIATAFDITERKQKEQEFALLAHSIKSISECVSITDADNNVLFVNEAFLKTYGYTREELIGKNISIVKSKRHQQPMNEILLATLKGGWQGELLNRKKNGEEFPVYLLTSTVRDDAGRAIGLIGVASDITDRKRVEESLTARARQQAAIAELGQLALEGGHLQQLMDHAVVLVAKTLDVEYSKVLELLPEGKSLLLRAGLGWRPGIVGYATVGASVDSQAGFTLQSGQPVIVEDLQAETRFSGPTLLTEHGVVSGISVIILGRKKPFGVLGAHTTHKRIFTVDDIQFLQSIANVLAIALQRKQAEQALRDSEERYRTLLQQSVEAIYLYDWQTKRVLEANPAFLKLLGYTADEVASLTLYDFVAHEKRSIDSNVDRAAQHGAFAIGERKWRHKNGALLDVDVTVGHIQQENRDIQFIVARDITERKEAEHQLRRLSRVVEQTADIVFITDINGVIEYVNPAFESTTGYSREEVLGKTPRILKSGEHPASFYEHLWKTILDGLQFRSILINRKKDGTVLFEQKTITPLREQDGTITHFVSTGKDITEQMKTVELLRQNDEKQRLVLSNIHEIVYSLRFEDGNFLTSEVDFVNDSVEDILGFGAKEFIMNPRLWLESLHPEDLAIVQESTERLLTDKKPITRLYRIKHKNTSEYRWMEDHVVPRVNAVDKKVVGIFGVARDITERKRAQKILQESEDRYRDLVEHSQDLVCTHDLEGRILSANPWAAKVLGYEIDTILRMNIRDFLAPGVRGGVDAYLAKIQKRGAANGRLLVQTAAGERRIWEYNNTLRTEGVATPIVRGMARDITERNQAEDAARAYSKRLQMLSKQLLEIQENERRAIARELHDEVGQALASLKMHLELSKKTNADKARQNVKDALEITGNLIERIRGLSLDLRSLMLEDLGLVPAVRWHLLHHTEKAGMKAIFVAEPENIHASREIETTCFRVAQEALTNVLKHSKAKSVEVQLMKRGSTLELAIRDDGTGFDVESAVRRASAGKSFGLLGMQERVRLAAGALIIRSEQGRGSEIQATFPNAFAPSPTNNERSADQ